jgi:hypothetical protein
MTTATWDRLAQTLLVGRTIKAVSYMSPKESKSAGFMRRPVAIELDNGTIVFPQADDEGNDGGALVCVHSDGSETVLPVL